MCNLYMRGAGGNSEAVTLRLGRTFEEELNKIRKSQNSRDYEAVNLATAREEEGTFNLKGQVVSPIR